MKSEQECREFSERELRPVISRLEAERKSALRVFWSVAACAASFAAVILMFMAGTVNEGPLFLIPIVLAVAVCAITMHVLNSGIRKKFKNGVMRRIVSFFGPDLDYNPKFCIPRNVFEDCRIFLTHIDRYRGEDLVYGTVGQTKIDFSEVHAEYKTTSRGPKGQRQTHWHTIFKGLFFTADFNKEFYGRTVVLPDTAENLFGSLGKMFQKANFRRDQIMNMDDPEFEKLFVVYGTDQIEARYILSNSLMRRIVDFRNRTGQRIYLSFCDSRVHVAVPIARNMFESRFFRSMAGEEFVNELLGDLRFALGIVDDLNLNTRIWSKRPVAQS